MKTIIKNASVKVMLSYNYCHFETSMTIENESGLKNIDIDNARKECQRLSDKAVKQYKIAKEAATNDINHEYDRERLIIEVRDVIKHIQEQDQTPDQKAKIKALDDWNFEKYHYDYDDDYDF